MHRLDSCTIENRSGTPRTIVLETRLTTNAKVTGTDEVDFDPSSNRPLFVFRVESAKRSERDVHSVEGLERRLSLKGLTSAALAPSASGPSLLASDRGAATAAAARLHEAEADDEAKVKVSAEMPTTARQREWSFRS